jgi:hypothetical protein
VALGGCGLAAESRVEVVGDERYPHPGLPVSKIEISRLQVASKKDYTRCRGPVESLTATAFPVCYTPFMDGASSFV